MTQKTISKGEKEAFIERSNTRFNLVIPEKTLEDIMSKDESVSVKAISSLGGYSTDRSLRVLSTIILQGREVDDEKVHFEEYSNFSAKQRAAAIKSLDGIFKNKENALINATYKPVMLKTLDAALKFEKDPALQKQLQNLRKTIDSSGANPFKQQK